VIAGCASPSTSELTAVEHITFVICDWWFVNH